MLKRILIALIAFLLLTSLASAATLQVGPKLHYKTIQNAVNDAHTGDTILVTAGTYKEKVIVKDKTLNFQGAKVKNKYVYPTVYGFEFSWDDQGNIGGGNINGFKITKTGIEYGLAGGIVRNNYFYNCGVDFSGSTCSGNQIINNQFTKGGIGIGYDSFDNLITGNKISNSKFGIYAKGTWNNVIKKNTFTKCGIAIYGYDSSFNADILKVNTFKGNKINLKENYLGDGEMPL